MVTTDEPWAYAHDLAHCGNGDCIDLGKRWHVCEPAKRGRPFMNKERAVVREIEVQTPVETQLATLTDHAAPRSVAGSRDSGSF
jgi:hypothetical protein